MTILTVIIGIAIGWAFPQPMWVAAIVSSIKAWWEARKQK